MPFSLTVPDRHGSLNTCFTGCGDNNKLHMKVLKLKFLSCTDTHTDPGIVHTCASSWPITHRTEYCVEASQTCLLVSWPHTFLSEPVNYLLCTEAFHAPLAFSCKATQDHSYVEHQLYVHSYTSHSFAFAALPDTAFSECDLLHGVGAATQYWPRVPK